MSDFSYCYRGAIRLNDEERLKEIKESLAKSKIILRLEREGKYLEKELSTKMIMALFDFQYMYDVNTWETVNLNNIKDELRAFFKIVDHIDDAMFDNKSSEIVNGEIVDCKEVHYWAGKPNWKKIKINQKV